MRAPKMLLQQLGWWKFIGFQITFLGALSQFFFAPALWSFWAIPFGYYHPLSEFLSSATLWTIGVIFFTTEIATILISMRAVSRTQHQKLKRWVPTLHFYYPLAALASYKGFYEILTRPFYWDKTDHGAFQPNHIHITDQDG
ncbi:hypothetical protein [Cochlodiniinecator piscidefendens]|uniref:hypothetical protein n=1 Tax=Cochlodiniinecator piscidefendens TaxID=2715756 RepID=UPI001407E6AC|nr:hypothetical protein [Cochlodiniinecator piscidefendens]